MTDSQFDRADRAAAAEGATFQSFAVAAIMRAVEDAEGRQDMARERKQARRGFGISAAGLASPSGLGIAASRAPQPVPPVSPLTPAPVVVNVGQAQTPSDDTVERMARYVLAGDDFDRPTRLQSAVEMLASSTHDEAERERLAQRLDDRIASLGTPQRAGGALKTTFESLKEWLP